MDCERKQQKKKRKLVVHRNVITFLTCQKEEMKSDQLWHLENVSDCSEAFSKDCVWATHRRACRRGQRTLLSVDGDRPTGARRLSHCEIFKMWCECFSAKQDCCVASFLLYFRGWFVCLFVKTVLFLPHFILFGNRCHSNLKSPGDLPFQSVSTGLRTAAGLNGRSFSFVVITIIIFLLHLLTHFIIALMLRSPVVRNIHNITHSVQPFIRYAEALNFQ